jgi:hypothetical protein
MDDHTRALLLAALDAIEAVREPDGFDAHDPNPSIVRLAAIDYRASYLSAAKANDKAHAAITAALDADGDDR